MKKILTSIILAAGLITAKGQSNSPVSFNLGTLQPLLQATNYAFEPYLTYAPGVPSGRRFGAGILAIYNVNDYVGAGLGVDYLGQATLVSANMELKLPIQPLANIAPTNSFLHSITVTPFALAGVGKPFSGAGGGAIAITDMGAAVSFGHLWGGQFNTGLAYGRWDNAGIYSGQRYHIFAGWSKGF